MSAKSLLTFRISGDYGHFGLRYATTSSPTHMIPPRHTIIGILGAILGVDRKDVAKTFHPEICDIGISVASPLSTLRIPLKSMKIKNRGIKSFMKVSEHNIVPYQFIRKPSYTIYFDHVDSDLKSRLKSMLEGHECVYPPSLGLAYLLADIEWTGEMDVSESKEDKLRTISSFPVDEVEVFPEPGNSVVFERFALYLDENRTPHKFHRVMVDIKGNPVSVTVKKSELAKPYTDADGNTIFMW